MVCFRTIRWSTVAHPLFPPACAFVIWTCYFTLSLIILSYTLPTLLVSVIPLSLEHFPFCPLPLYILIISPSAHSSGMFSLLCAFSIIVFSAFLVSSSASINIWLGSLSGPRLFFLFSFFISFCISLSDIISSWFRGGGGWGDGLLGF